MTTPYARERRLAELAVFRASILTKRVQSSVSEIPKADNSPVTIADFAAQALLVGALRDAFPNDSFLGEEDSTALREDEALRNKIYELLLCAPNVTDPEASSSALPTPASVDEMLDLIDLGGRGTGGDKGRFWVMDPVDGTATFLKGQQYGVSLSLIEDGKEVLGVLGCPNIGAEMSRVSEEDIDKNGSGIMLTAVRGQGATIRTMTSDRLEDAFPLSILGPSNSNTLYVVDCATATANRHDVVSKLANNLEATISNMEIWSSHIRYAALIVGGGDVQLWVPASPSSKMYIWDHAGTQLIYTELGGKITDLDGKDMDFGAGRDFNRNRGLVVARVEIHKALRVAVNKVVEEL